MALKVLNITYQPPRPVDRGPHRGAHRKSCQNNTIKIKIKEVLLFFVCYFGRLAYMGVGRSRYVKDTVTKHGNIF